jgi:hypothetical protein
MAGATFNPLLEFVSRRHDDQASEWIARKLAACLDYGDDAGIALGIPSTADGRRRRRDDELRAAASALAVDPGVKRGRPQTDLHRRAVALQEAIKEYNWRRAAWRRFGVDADASPAMLHLYYADRWAKWKGLPVTRATLRAILAAPEGVNENHAEAIDI